MLMMRTRVVVLILVLVWSLLGLLPVSAQLSEPPVELGDVSGDDPVETALAYSGLVADGDGERVLVATSATFADSLASGLLQGHWNAPLLLTPGDHGEGMDIR